MALALTMDKFKTDELTGSTELAKYFSENYNAVRDKPEANGISGFKIRVIDDEGELEAEEFAFIKDTMIEEGNSEIWVCWREDEGELEEWWITGDQV